MNELPAAVAPDNRRHRLKGNFLPANFMVTVGLAGIAWLLPLESRGSDEAGDPFDWPAYLPDLNYHFTNDYPHFDPPSAVLDDCAGVAGTVTSGWWCFRYGSNMNHLVTSNAWIPMLERLNRDFAYFRNTMGWPPDRRAKRGYYSAVYLFGSGLATDAARNTEPGGWMGNIFFKDQNWAMILASYYPVYAFDPSCTNKDRAYQMGGLIHEGVHAILADMPGCRNAGWFHEGGNNWLLAEAAAQQSGNYREMGWLSAGAMIAPFMPIECYSGWLQDGSFGGPSAEGVNIITNGNQLCTWRRLLGGTQYGEAFAHFMGENVSRGSIAWIWQNCTNRVLEGLATAKGGLGDRQTRRLIMEYRARQAMCDFGKWSEAYKTLLRNNWGHNITAEYEPIWIKCEPWKATCYVATTRKGGTLIPEERTLPGWSGANQVPMKVSGREIVRVTFQPAGENMTCQLLYRAKDGSIVYGVPAKGGTCSLRLVKPVKNSVVIAVICNTDYRYEGDITRRRKFDYRLVPVSGIDGPADIYEKWWE